MLLCIWYFLQETIAEVIGLFEKTVMSVNTLTAHPDFDSVTQPENIKVVEKLWNNVHMEGNLVVVNVGMLKTVVHC